MACGMAGGFYVINKVIAVHSHVIYLHIIAVFALQWQS